MAIGFEKSTFSATPKTRAIYRRVLGDRDPVGQPGTATGSRGDYYWTTLALVSDIFKLSTEMFSALLVPRRKLDPRLPELAILRTAIVGDSNFEYLQHLKASQMPEMGGARDNFQRSQTGQHRIGTRRRNRR